MLTSVILQESLIYDDKFEFSIVFLAIANGLLPKTVC